VGKFAASIERPKTKSASSSGGALPLSPDIGLRYGARHGAVPPNVAG